MEYPINLTISLEALHIARHALQEYAESFKSVHMAEQIAKALAAKADIESAIEAWIKS